MPIIGTRRLFVVLRKPNHMEMLQLQDINPVEIMPGFRGRMVHTPKISIVYFSIKGGSTFSVHAHSQEQVSNLVSGNFELTVNGKAHLMEPGKIIVIAPGEMHSGRALTDCEIIDTFCPVREDYRSRQS